MGNVWGKGRERCEQGLFPAPCVLRRVVGKRGGKVCIMLKLPHLSQVHTFPNLPHLAGASGARSVSPAWSCASASSADCGQTSTCFASLTTSCRLRFFPRCGAGGGGRRGVGECEKCGGRVWPDQNLLRQNLLRQVDNQLSPEILSKVWGGGECGKCLGYLSTCCASSTTGRCSRRCGAGACCSTVWGCNKCNGCEDQFEGASVAQGPSCCCQLSGIICCVL